MKVPKDVETIIAGHTPQDGKVNSGKINNVSILYVDNSRNKDKMIGIEIGNDLIREIDMQGEIDKCNDNVDNDYTER